jgi:hypothetical protein
MNPPVSGVGDDPVAIEQLAAALAAATCAFDQRCSTYLNRYRATPGGCPAFYEPYLGDGIVAPLRAAIAAGRSTYDAAAMGACLSWIAARACGADEVEEGAACAAAFNGTRKVGEACVSDYECEDAATCGNPADDSSCPALVCVARAAVGASCEAAACVAGARCVDAGAGRLCVASVGLHAACASNEHCRSGLYCQLAAGATTGACEPPTFAALGETCAELGGIACREGSCQVVDDVNGELIYQCVAMAASGGSCKTSVWSDNCPVGEACSVLPGTGTADTAKCLPLAKVGEACRVNPGAEGAPLIRCEAFSSCDETSHCKPLASIGEACTTSGSCFSAQCGKDLKCEVPTSCDYEG